MSVPPEYGDDDLRYGSAPARRDRLQRMVEDQGFCTITELSDQLGVSDMTIRRDVQRLVQDGLLRSVHGGVSALPQSALAGSLFSTRAVTLAPEKRAIAAAAAALVPVGGAVGLDAGTTTLELARAWPSERRATVVTHSLPNVLALHDDEYTRVIVLGGVLHQSSQSLSGPMTLRTLEELRLEVVFLAASGLSERGVFCGNDFDAVTKRALIEVADRVVLLSDSSKFDSTAMVRVCGLEALDHVVMDDRISSEDQELLRSHGIELQLVSAAAEMESR